MAMAMAAQINILLFTLAIVCMVSFVVAGNKFSITRLFVFFLRLPDLQP
jgi:hypothetical protein